MSVENRPMLTRIDLRRGNLITFEGDAIVNAANTRLARGGGVCGAIHAAAGTELTIACIKLGGCRTGDAVITPGFKLPAKYVIHAVGPIWSGGNANEEADLSSAYRRSLEVAVDNDVKTLAFPTLSAGSFRFPLRRAVEIAIEETLAFLENDDSLSKVTFFAFDDRAFETYQDVLRKHQAAAR